MTLTLYSSSEALSELETYVFTTSLSLESSRTSSDPLSEKKFASGPRVAELGMEDGVITNEDRSLTAYARVAKSLLVEITGGGVAGEVLLAWDALLGMAPFWRMGVLAKIRMDSPLTTP